MYSRRLLRIKVMQVLYAYLKSEDPSLSHSEKELFHSVEKSYDLYHYLLLLVIDVRQYAQGRIELAMEKKRPTYEDLHPNTRFVDNAVIRQSPCYEHLISRYRIGWRAVGSTHCATSRSKSGAGRHWAWLAKADQGNRRLPWPWFST